VAAIDKEIEMSDELNKMLSPKAQELGVKISMKVILYETSDGHNFNHEAQAIDHQIEINLRAWLLQSSFQDGAVKASICNFILHHRHNLTSILKGENPNA
jgi:hypothetical protein